MSIPRTAIDIWKLRSVIILDSPDFQRLLKDVGAKIVDPAAVRPKG
jgi:phage-related baseplate assembly protein